MKRIKSTNLHESSRTIIFINSWGCMNSRRRLITLFHTLTIQMAIAPGLFGTADVTFQPSNTRRIKLMTPWIS